MAYTRTVAIDRDQTRKFIDLGDRDIAPFFAGRAAEIRHFESSFNTLDWANKRSAAFRVGMGLDKDHRFRAGPDEFANALVERGVLAIGSEGCYGGAIPSMAEWLRTSLR